MSYDYQRDDVLSAAWLSGREEAERLHTYAKMYDVPFSLTGVTLPWVYEDGTRPATAFRDGYTIRAKQLVDGESGE